MDNHQVMIGGASGILGEWGVERSDNQYEGPIPIRKAFALSKNAASVRVGIQAGLDSVLKLAKAAGINDDLRPFPATFLGSSEVTLGDLVTAYTIFPDEGSRPDSLMLITPVDTPDGKDVFRAEPAQHKIIDSQIAYEVHSFLSDALSSGTGSVARSEYGLRNFFAPRKPGNA